MKSQVRNCFTVHIKHHSTAEEDWFNNEVVVTQTEKAEIKEGERWQQDKQVKLYWQQKKHVKLYSKPRLKRTGSTMKPS